MYMKRIECEENERDKAECYKEMSRRYKENDIARFLQYSQQAIDLNRMAGRHSAAATITKECAQVLEENYEYEQAADWYAQTASIYTMDNQTAQSHTMLLKSNELKIETKQWDQLVSVLQSYRTIAKRYLTQQLTKTSAKNLLFMNVLCSLAMNDVVGAKKATQAHSIEDANFDGSQEMKLLEDIVRCIQEHGADRAEFSGLVATYNSVHPSSKARNSLMVKIQEVYCPAEEKESVIEDAFVSNPDEIDFTGGIISSSSQRKDGGLAAEDDLDFR
jgi:alpha-soluble NSF attachment protein